MDKLDLKSIIWRIKYWLKEVGLGIKNVFRKNSVRKIRNLCLVLLAVLFIIAIFYHNMGRFTVTVDPGAQKKGLYLYNSSDFKDAKTNLFGAALEECNNININDLPLDIDEIEGMHYGDNYLAYTFYVRNEGVDVLDYEYSLNIGDKTKNVDSAVWVMLFKNGAFELFAKARTDGSLERQYTYDAYPILKLASQEYEFELSEAQKGLLSDEEAKRLGIVDVNGLLELRTQSFISDDVITKGIVEQMDPGEYDKYTVVAWLEGEDPECLDDIIGGYIEMNMMFEIIDIEEETETQSESN